MEGALLLDVVVAEGSVVLELLSSEDESLLVWWDSLLVLDLSLDVVNGVRRLNIKGDGLASQCLDEDLHATSQSQHKVKSGFLLDVVVAQSSVVLELLASEDESLLVWRNTLFVLDLSLDIIDGVARLHIKGDSLASESLDEDLHTSPESEHKVEGGLLLDVVVRESSIVLELLASEDESLLIWWDSLFVLNLGLNVVNGIAGFDVQGDGLASQCLDEDLHATSETEHKMESGLLLDVVIGQGPVVLQLLASEDQSLLVRRNAFLVLNLGLDIVDGVRWLDIESDGLASKGLHEDLHFGN